MTSETCEHCGQVPSHFDLFGHCNSCLGLNRRLAVWHAGESARSNSVLREQLEQHMRTRDDQDD
jgi:hypothetical protein